MPAEILSIDVKFTVRERDQLVAAGRDLYPIDVGHELRAVVRAAVDTYYAANRELFACEPDIC